MNTPLRRHPRAWHPQDLPPVGHAGQPPAAGADGAAFHGLAVPRFAVFQARAMARGQQSHARGNTLLFVGHDLQAVRALCHEAMLPEQGRIVLHDMTEEVVTEYLYRVQRKARIKTAAAHQQPDKRVAGDCDRGGTGVRTATMA